VVNIPTEGGGYQGFQLFKHCRVDPDDDGEWFVEIDAHDEALPLMFEFKERYFTYKLWNALRLKSSNQLRMYEILKQYEWVGERVIPVRELKELLGIGAKEYPRYNDFRTHVLDVCQRALQENTDISYTYEPAGKKGKSGKILHLKFMIQKNNEYKDQLTLTEFLSQQESMVILDDDVESGEDDDYFAREIFPFISEACGSEFGITEVQVLYNLLVMIIPPESGERRQLEMFGHLKRRYDELNWRAGRSEIRNRFGYLKKLLEEDIRVNG
jgi:hypothetical protein